MGEGDGLVAAGLWWGTQTRLLSRISLQALVTLYPNGFMKKIAVVAVLLALVSSGCTKPTSNLDANSPGGRIMYPITAGEADGVISRALNSTLPGANVTPVATPYKGYVAVATFPRETRTYTYTATAVPAVGLKPDGTRANGFAFDVSGSRIGPGEHLFEAINLGAATLNAPLPLARPGQ